MDYSSLRICPYRHPASQRFHKSVEHLDPGRSRFWVHKRADPSDACFSGDSSFFTEFLAADCDLEWPARLAGR